MILAAQQAQPEVYAGIDEMLNVTVTIFSVLIGFSALIAAVGMVNNLSLSVLQRTRELGLLRALGFSGAQLRRMIVAESAQLTLAAIAARARARIGYGWAGAQSLLGGAQGEPVLVLPAVPWVMFGVLSSPPACSRWSPRSRPRAARCGSPRWSRSRSSRAPPSSDDERMPRRSGIRSSVMVAPARGPGVSLGSCFTACFSLAAATSPNPGLPRRGVRRRLNPSEQARRAPHEEHPEAVGDADPPLPSVPRADPRRPARPHLAVQAHHDRHRAGAPSTCATATRPSSTR